MAKEKRSFYGTGRRKSSVARVILTPGKGKITVNGRDVSNLKSQGNGNNSIDYGRRSRRTLLAKK